MSPTICRERGLRFFFFSREEQRVHVSSADGQAMLWIEPAVELERTDGLSRKASARL